MGLFGKILSLPVRIVNAPIRAAGKGMDYLCGDEHSDGKSLLSMPLDKLAEAIEEIDDDE
jgi:hypothetical protein